VIILPIVGAITAAQVGLWALGGAISAGVGVLVRRVFKLRASVNALTLRLEELEK
jgi:hypothetical protein